MSELTGPAPGNAPEPDNMVAADRAYRAVIFGVYALIVLFGFIAFRYLIPFGLAYLRTLGWKQLLQTLRLVFILLLLSFSPAAIYLIVIGRRILRHGCWPYPGRKVMFDTKVLRGDEARSRGKLMIALGTVFLVLMVASVAYVYIRYTGWLRSPLLKKYLFHESAVWIAPPPSAKTNAETACPGQPPAPELASDGSSFPGASQRIFRSMRRHARAGPFGPG